MVETIKIKFCNEAEQIFIISFTQRICKFICKDQVLIHVLLLSLKTMDTFMEGERMCTLRVYGTRTG